MKNYCMTAKINVDFFSGGISDTLTVTVNRHGIKESQSVDFNGGTMTFNNVSSNDSIKIDGHCLGKAVVTIDVPLNNDPKPSYPAGNILDFFTVN